MKQKWVLKIYKSESLINHAEIAEELVAMLPVFNKGY